MKYLWVGQKVFSLSQRKRFIFLIFVLLISNFRIAQAQDYNHVRFAFTADLGSQFQRGGLLLQFNHSRNRLEFVSGAELKYAFKGYGPQKGTTEVVFHLGAAFSHKNQILEQVDGRYLPFHFFRRNKDKFQYGYTFHYYLDQFETSQGTGTISLKFGDVYFITENDLIGNLKGKDQYRTGALGLFFTKNNLTIGTKSALWTGQTRCASMVREKESDYPARFGYKKVDGCKHSKFSHGLLSLEASYIFDDSLIPSVAFGRDDERIRNLIQNKFIHDMRFVPKKFNTAENPHLPMLDANGNQYLFRKNQEIKPGKWFAQFGLNHGWFY